jgi:hypothetical protein
MYDNSPFTDLMPMIGKTFSDNHSSTLRSKLVAMSWKPLRCRVQEVPSEWYPEVKNPGIKTYSLDQVHRSFFGI